MPKTWIICIDGTWNQPGQRDKDPITAQEEGAPSNVVRTWEALANTLLATEFYYGSIAPLKPKILFTGVEGEVIYLAGIGTSGTVDTHILEEQRAPARPNAFVMPTDISRNGIAPAIAFT